MRLLKVDLMLKENRPVLEEFVATFPAYAILSHTWGREEFLFEDIKNNSGKEKEGYEKIKNCCAVAAADDFHYVWVDTCCIDKSSSAELSESINSMFEWYANSVICYVYLCDVDMSGSLGGSVSEKQFRESRWASRGWTLQELIAPDFVRFYSRDWTPCGNRTNLASPLYEVTNIDLEILRRSANTDRRDWLHSLSVSKRMSWASKRQTTRREDEAYCLLGLFGVSMPMLYGEGGPKAFYRLQEEIMKHSTDQTILAWSPKCPIEHENMSVLAASPSDFHDGFRIIPIEQNEHQAHFEMTSRGLRIASRLYDPIVTHPQDNANSSADTRLLLLSCIYADDTSGQIGIYIKPIEMLERVSEHNAVFVRTVHSPTIIHVQHLKRGGIGPYPNGLLYAIGEDLGWNPELRVNSYPQIGNHAKKERKLLRARFGLIRDYLQQLESPSIYIAHIINRSQHRETNGTVLYFPPIYVGIHFGKKFCLTCPDLGISHPNSAELQTAKLGASQLIQVELVELGEVPENNISIFRVKISRSRDDSSLLEICDGRCLCGYGTFLLGGYQIGFKGYNLHSGSSNHSSSHIRCTRCGILVCVNISKKRISTRFYNSVQFDVFIDKCLDPDKSPTED